MNLAKRDGISVEIVHQVFSARDATLSQDIQAVARLTEAVFGRREDDDVARQAVQSACGDAGLIELGNYAPENEVNNRGPHPPKSGVSARANAARAINRLIGTPNKVILPSNGRLLGESQPMPGDSRVDI